MSRFMFGHRFTCIGIMTTAFAFGSPALAVQGETTTVDGRVLPRILEGTVATIQLWRLETSVPRGSTEMTVRLAHQVSINPDGSFRIQNVRSGYYWVDCTLPFVGSVRFWRLISARHNPAILDILSIFGMESPEGPGNVISGLIEDPNGAPVSEATVTLTSPINPAIYEQARTNDRGRFEISVGPGGFMFYYQIAVYSRGLRPFSRVYGFREWAGDLTIEMSPSDPPLQVEEFQDAPE